MSEARSEAAAEAGDPTPQPPRPGVVRILRRIIVAWALIGGAILLLLALMTAGSALSNLFFHRPFAPDYELMKHLVAIAVFCFLPFCQMTGANVTADIFTERMGPRAKAAMAALGALLAIVFAAMLLVQMQERLVGDLGRTRVEETPVLHLPLWTAYPPILLSLLLLLAAGGFTLAESVRALKSPERLAAGTGA